MRLIKTDGQGNIENEVKSHDPVYGLYDAARVAMAEHGDGTYWADKGDGQYYEFTIQNGQVHEFNEDGWRSGNPADQVDDADLDARVNSPVSSLGGMFSSSPNSTERGGDMGFFDSKPTTGPEVVPQYNDSKGFMMEDQHVVTEQDMLDTPDMFATTEQAPAPEQPVTEDEQVEPTTAEEATDASEED